MLATLFQNRFATSNHLPANGSLMGSDTSLVNEQRLVVGIILASICYQAILCLLNTQVHIASRALVGASEALIVLACVPILARRMLYGTTVLLLLTGALLTVSSLVSGELAVKAGFSPAGALPSRTAASRSTMLTVQPPNPAPVIRAATTPAAIFRGAVSLPASPPRAWPG